MKKLVILLIFILVGCSTSFNVTNEYYYEKVIAGENVMYVGQNSNEYYFTKQNNIVSIDKITLEEKSLNISVEPKEHPYIEELEGKVYLRTNNNGTIRVYEGLNKEKLVCEGLAENRNQRCDEFRDNKNDFYPIEQAHNTITINGDKKHFFEKIEVAQVIDQSIYVILNHFEEYRILIFDEYGNEKNRIDHLPRIGELFLLEPNKLVGTNSATNDVFIIDLNSQKVEKMDKNEKEIFSLGIVKLVYTLNNEYAEYMQIKKK